MYNRLKNHTTQHKRYNLCEGSLEVKLPTIWTDGKAEGKSQRREEKKREDQRRGRVRGKKTQAREKVEQSRFNAFFQWFVTPLWREAHFEVKMHKTLQCWTSFRTWDVEKVDAAVAPSTFPSKNVQNTPGSDYVEMSKKCTPLWREAHLEVNMCKTHQLRTTFGSWDVEKVHAVVARSTFPSQNVQNTTCSRHFWRFGCWKSARRCGAKHISKSKCTKHHMFAPLLEVRMLKKCTPLWREAHFQVKMYTIPHVRATLGGSDVAKVHVVVARSTFPSQNAQNTTCSRHFWRFGCWKSARRWGAKHISTTLHSTTVHYVTQHYNYNYNYTTTLHYTKLHYTKLHYTKLHYTTVHYTTLHYNYNYTTTLHYTKLHYTTLHYTTLHYNYNYTTTLHYNTLHYTPLHSTKLNYSTLHYITLHYTPRHYTTLHYTTFHYTSLHYTTLHSTTLQLQLRLHNYTPLHSTTRNYTTLHYTTFHYTPLHYTTWHYTTLHWMTLHHR